VEPTPPLSLEQYQHLHLLTQHVGPDVLGVYRKKYEEVRDAWARVYPPGKAIPVLKDAPDAERRARAYYSGDGRADPKAPRTDFHDFQRRWQSGAASLADLAQQVEQVNEILRTRKEETIAPLPERTKESDASAARLAALESEVADLRGAVANLTTTTADVTRALVKLDKLAERIAEGEDDRDQGVQRGARAATPPPAPQTRAPVPDFDVPGPTP
jgi:hypothetical protein